MRKLDAKNHLMLIIQFVEFKIPQMKMTISVVKSGPINAWSRMQNFYTLLNKKAIPE